MGKYFRYILGLLIIASLLIGGDPRDHATNDRQETVASMDGHTVSNGLVNQDNGSLQTGMDAAVVNTAERCKEADPLFKINSSQVPFTGYISLSVFTIAALLFCRQSYLLSRQYAYLFRLTPF
jgi:hypothetical protein